MGALPPRARATSAPGDEHDLTRRQPFEEIDDADVGHVVGSFGVPKHSQDFGTQLDKPVARREGLGTGIRVRTRQDDIDSGFAQLKQGHGSGALEGRPDEPRNVSERGATL